MLSYLELLRPHQWVKNFFVFIPLIFARQYFDSDLFLLSVFAFFVFVLASCSVYVLNDVVDYPYDRLHPEKKKRPIASGKVPLRSAIILWVILTFLSLTAATFLSASFFLLVVSYLLMTIAYSLFLKRIIFLDVILIALGFVFRVLAGGVAIDIIVTDWMMVLVFLLTLFLSISKRRQEIKNLEHKSKKTRKVLTDYTIDLIDQLNAIIVPIVITSYIVYTFSQRENNPYFIATIPLVVYAFFRYLYLLKSTNFGESSKDYLADWQLLVIGIVWFILAMKGLSI